MAAVDPSRALQEELFCAICLDYFSEPVILSCGHNFCRACIFAYWQGLENRFPCPQCRKRSYLGKVRPNSQLGKVAERAKELASLLAEPPKAPADSAACPCSKAEAPGEVCQQHGEPLKVFCQEDETLICVVCDRSKEHRGHAVVPREEAAKEYKTQFGCHLENLKAERDSRETLAVNQGKKLKMLVDSPHIGPPMDPAVTSTSAGNTPSVQRDPGFSSFTFPPMDPNMLQFTNILVRVGSFMQILLQNIQGAPFLQTQALGSSSFQHQPSGSSSPSSHIGKRSHKRKYSGYHQRPRG